MDLLPQLQGLEEQLQWGDLLLGEPTAWLTLNPAAAWPADARSCAVGPPSSEDSASAFPPHPGYLPCPSLEDQPAASSSEGRGELEDDYPLAPGADPLLAALRLLEESIAAQDVAAGAGGALLAPQPFAAAATAAAAPLSMALLDLPGWAAAAAAPPPAAQPVRVTPRRPLLAAPPVAAQPLRVTPRRPAFGGKIRPGMYQGAEQLKWDSGECTEAAPAAGQPCLPTSKAVAATGRHAARDSPCSANGPPSPSSQESAPAAPRRARARRPAVAARKATGPAPAPPAAAGVPKRRGQKRGREPVPKRRGQKRGREPTAEASSSPADVEKGQAQVAEQDVDSMYALLPHVAYLTPPNMRKNRGGRLPAPDPRLDPTISAKRAKRILANRLAAAKSKLRKQAKLKGLAAQVEGLEGQRAALQAQLAALGRGCAVAEEEQGQLKAQLAEVQASMDHQA